jgi:hypothetical protein
MLKGIAAHIGGGVRVGLEKVNTKGDAPEVKEEPQKPQKTQRVVI